MNEIYYPLKQNPLDRFEDSKKLPAKEQAAKQVRLKNNAGDSQDETGPSEEARQRLALQKEFTYQALLVARALFARDLALAEKEVLLLNHIRDTRFLDQAVLEEWQPELLEIFKNQDAQAFDKLLAKAESHYALPAKDLIISENMAALASQKPFELLNEVVKELKTIRSPQLTIKPQRVLDLLT